MQRLKYLILNNNALTGGLPETWGNDHSFPSLIFANLVSPPEVHDAAIYCLTCITLTVSQAANNLSGSLPASWFTGSPFQSLTLLSLAGNNLSGSLPLVSPDCSLCKTKVRSSRQCTRAWRMTLCCSCRPKHRRCHRQMHSAALLGAVAVHGILCPSLLHPLTLVNAG